MVSKDKTRVTLAQSSGFDEWIDVRSPAEYALDHCPGAINCAVLDDAERALVGTVYKQESPFAARRLGAPLVAANIARHLQQRLADKPREWRPLVYCWRGGERSGAFVSWLRMVGWQACRLEGGYKAWRRSVVAALEAWPQAFDWRVVCGATGSGKTRVLAALAAQGEQVLDLEALAAHKGSVLGALPGVAQPAQKAFETAIYVALQGFDRERPVYVEAESRKIGMLFVPEALMCAMRAAPCLYIEASLPARLDFLLEDYGWFLQQPTQLVACLARLTPLHGRERVQQWQQWAQQGELRLLFADLITRHYDPLYRRSQGQHFDRLAAAPRFACQRLDADAVGALARQMIETPITRGESGHG